MNLSYWEHDTFLQRFDFAIIGSGIVGLNCALHLRQQHPSSRIAILERGFLPSGASTKNAGFACFGSISELEDDLNSTDLSTTLQTVEKRWKGLQVLRNLIPDEIMQFQHVGGLEVFSATEASFADSCVDRIDFWNKELQQIIGPGVYDRRELPSKFNAFHSAAIFNQYEGLLHPGAVMNFLLGRCKAADIKIFTGLHISGFDESDSSVLLLSDDEPALAADQLLVATNGFSKQFFPSADVSPARNQVLVTSRLEQPLPSFGYHLDRGYFYFRPIGDRVLIGGGRHLSPKTENTSEFGTTEIIENALMDLLKEKILPGQDFSIDHKWSGILGIGKEKSAIVKRWSPRVCSGIRLGGMGVAIGSLVGKELAELCD